ncbi:hypothetical protein [Actinocrispum wychmicini]|uniref:Uncharacterized protein n=1 Tax=Actinocrispum wychmicini TaxID=1213861 RepID=A0A4R2J681_9PSEU|nr:hypothetical protein [Actinocrispum wychmicini]TCO53527.1 hypothetical protein EV192_110116 [Actinocrispum wychmicini]
MVPSEPPEPSDQQEPPTPDVGPPARRGNRKLTIAIAAAVVVVVGGGVTLIAVASNGSPQEVALRKDTADARAVSEKFAVLFGQARNDGVFALSESDVKALLCTREQDALDQEWQDRQNKEINRPVTPVPNARLQMTVRDVRIHGDNGVATLTGAIADRRTDQDFQLLKEDGQWKVCDVVFRIPKASGTNTLSPSTSDGSTPPSSSSEGTPDTSSTTSSSGIPS